ncbi:SH3 domain-containing protein [Gemmiger sp.]
MSELRKKAMTRLVICAVALVACIIFSVLLLTGTFDGKTSSGDVTPAASDVVSDAVSGVEDPTASDFTAQPEETPAENTETPAEEQPAEPEATPEPTPVPEYDGLSVQPTTYYNEGEQPSYTVTPDNNLNMRAGPGTDYDKVSQVPASTVVTALGANEDGSWVVVNYNGTYGWLKTEYLS